MNVACVTDFYYIAMLALSSCIAVSFTPHGPLDSPDKLFKYMRSASHSVRLPSGSGPPARVAFQCGSSAWLVEAIAGEEASVSSCSGGSCPHSDVQITVAPDTLAAIIERRLSPLT